MDIPTPPEEGGGTAGELAYRLRQQQLTCEFGLFALKSHDVQALLDEAARVCAEGLQSRLCKLLEYMSGEHRFLVRAGVGWHPGVVGHATIGADLESPAGYAFQTGRPVISNHLGEEDRFRTPQVLADHGVRRAINVLIQGETDRFGVLEVDSSDEGRFTDADLAFLQAFANLIGVALERHKIEEELKRHQKIMHETAAHQEVLTREISHRVKNSLSIVAGLLRMQGRSTTNEELRQALDDAHRRIQTIAQLHDRLWRTNEVLTVDLAEFLDELCSALRASGKDHNLTCDVVPITVATDQAVSIGLLVNELVTNALKYAYPDGKGDVHLSVQPIGGDVYRFEVRDHGVGFPAGFDADRSKSLGMRLVRSLATQLGGQLSWKDGAPGTLVTLDFQRQESNHPAAIEPIEVAPGRYHQSPHAYAPG